MTKKSRKIFDEIFNDMYEYLESTEFASTLQENNPDLIQLDYNKVINTFLESFIEHIEYSDPEFYKYYQN